MRFKILILAIALSGFMSFQFNFFAGVEDYCLTGGGPDNSGSCETTQGLPSETNPGEEVSVKRCNFNIGAPGQEINCSGNSLDPK